MDPARNGAAVLLAPDKSPTVAYCWRQRAKDGRPCYDLVVVAVGGHQRREVVPSLHRVSCVIAASIGRVSLSPSWGVAVEAPIVSRINPSVGLVVAMLTGELLGPMRETMPPSGPVMVKATEWRQELLGLHHRTPRERCKMVSLATMPVRLPGLESLLSRAAGMHGCEVAKLDHITDAGGVAEWGYNGAER